MRYEDLLESAIHTATIPNREIADGVVKATLGILLSRMQETDAREFAQGLPSPLTYEKLRGRGALPSGLTVEQYIREISTQFGLSFDEAQRVIEAILHQVKTGTNPDCFHRWEQHLPQDWVGELESA